MNPNHEEDPVLVAVATTIADGLPVDWRHLIEDHPALAGELQALRELERIELARRSLASPRADEPS